MSVADRDVTGPTTRDPGVARAGPVWVWLGLAVAGVGVLLTAAFAAGPMWAFAALGIALGVAILLARRYLIHVTVRGNSMAPQLQHGDGVLALRCPPATVRQGHVVVGLIPDGHVDPEALAAGIPPYFVKRVVGVAGDRVERPDGTLLTVPEGSFYVRGTAQYSVDSGVWGPVDRSRLLGVVLRRLSRRAND